MSERELNVVAGALARAVKPKATQLPDALSKRWRASANDPEPVSERPDVIPLLDGWIRRLEREAGADSSTQQR